jgi:hypothetical protein
MPAPLSPEQRADLNLDLPVHHTPSTKQLQVLWPSGDLKLADAPRLQPPSSSPFIYTPYALCAKASMMLMGEPGAKVFANEALAELLKHYPTPAPSELADDVGRASQASARRVSLGTPPLDYSPSTESSRPTSSGTAWTKKSHAPADLAIAMTDHHRRQRSSGSSYHSDPFASGGRVSQHSMHLAVVSPRIDEDDEKIRDDMTPAPPAMTLPPDFWKSAPAPVTPPRPLSRAAAMPGQRPRTAPTAAGQPESPLRRAARLSPAAIASRSISASRPRTTEGGMEMGALRRHRSAVDMTWHAAALQSLASGPQRSQLLGVDL